MSPTKGEEGHISFSADPGRRHRREKFVSIILLESVGGGGGEYYQTCMDTILGQAKELIKFW